jgi:hypothetical protein
MASEGIALAGGEGGRLFDAAARIEQIDAVERRFVDRGRLIELGPGAAM